MILEESLVEWVRAVCARLSRLEVVASGGTVEEKYRWRRSRRKIKLQNTNYYGGCDNPMYVCGGA